MTVARRAIALVVLALMMTACGSWKGIANVPLPGGPGTGSKAMTVYVQMPDTLALNVNSRVRVADVYVGRVRSIELKNWVPTLTLDLDSSVKLPAKPGADGFSTLNVKLPKAARKAQADLCVYFTGDTRPTMWVLDRMTLVPATK